MAARLATTQWSQVLEARDGCGTEARRAMESLCRTYWPPLYGYVRSLGHDADQAQELTQGFFAYLLEKDILQNVDRSLGRFRSFLLTSIKHFIAHEYRKEKALKRGGGATPLPLESPIGEDLLTRTPVEELTPEQSYEYQWGLIILDRALVRLRVEWSNRGNERLFERLQPHLTGQEPRTPFRKIGEEIGMTETATRGAMYRLRQRYGELIRAEIGETVAESEDIDDEVRHLLTVIRPWGPEPR